MRLSIVFLLLWGISFLSFSQEIGEEVRDGITYKIYVVKAGNTLYSLQKEYGVSVEDIIKANPSAEKGLQTGQKLYIPIKETSSEENPNQQNYIVHEVDKKETLYGISRKYGCTVEELIQLNPGVEDGLQAGQTIKIPSKDGAKSTGAKTETPTETVPQATIDLNTKTLVEDSIVSYTVQKGETIYSISKRFMVSVETLIAVNKLKSNSIQEGQVIQIPLKKEQATSAEMKDIDRPSDRIRIQEVNYTSSKEKYKILIALPLKVESNPDVLSGMFTQNTHLNNLTELSVEFLMGAQMALDSLEKLGLRADVEFFDTKSDFEAFKKFLGTENSAKWDMIIGPFYPNLYEYAAEWGKNNKVPVIAVTKVATKTLENNPYALSVVPSDLTLIGGMAKYLAINHATDNIVMIQGDNTALTSKNTHFKNMFEKHIPTGKSGSIRMGTIGDASGKTLLGYIDLNKKNYIVYLSDNVQQVMRFVNALNAAKNTSPKYNNAEIVMVGLREWNDFIALNAYYKNRFNFHFPSTSYLNYDLNNIIDFTVNYRTRYGSDPSKYSFHGFDVVLSQVASIMLGMDRNKGLISYFSMDSVGNSHGKENSSVFISAQKDFDLLLMEIETKEKSIPMMEAEIQSAE
ncbi:MAG: LysM peptidoglycan-binding domain-containing protein [Brumimicrobium sp.]|nr:LysM peptidoglycan-binding domain-containing protein [Brumimicrobium sp.]